MWYPDSLAVEPVSHVWVSVLSCDPSVAPQPRQVGWWVPSGLAVAHLSCLAPSLALSSLNKHAEAVAYYKKALELDPDNDTYKSNLKIAELKLREAPSPVSPHAGGGDGRPGWSPCVGRKGWREAGEETWMSWLGEADAGMSGGVWVACVLRVLLHLDIGQSRPHGPWGLLGPWQDAPLVL